MSTLEELLTLSVAKVQGDPEVPSDGRTHIVRPRPKAPAWCRGGGAVYHTRYQREVQMAKLIAAEPEEEF